MCLFKSCIRHQPLKMLEQDCRFVTLRRNAETNDKILKKHKYWKIRIILLFSYAELSKALTLRWKQMLILKKHKYWKNQNHSALLHMLNFQRHWWGFPGLCIQVSAQLFANIAKDCPTVCQHLRRWPNLLQILPNCLPSMSYTGQLFASFAEHRPTVCQPLVTQIIKLNPSGFCLGSCFFPSVIVVLCFLFFHRLSAGSFIYLNDGN